MLLYFYVDKYRCGYIDLDRKRDRDIEKGIEIDIDITFFF